MKVALEVASPGIQGCGRESSRVASFITLEQVLGPLTPSRTANCELEILCGQLLGSLVTLLELRNPYDIDHCRLVAHYCREIGAEAGLPKAVLDRTVRAAEVHTLGVHLQMEEKLTHQSLPVCGPAPDGGRAVPIHRREEQILRHALGPTSRYGDCVEVLLRRHDWYRERGDAIPTEARLLAVADAFVDLATPKAHRPPEPAGEVLSRIQEMSRTQFDPAFVEALARVMERSRWDASARQERFNEARCRHYLGLGRFYTQIHEWDWALRTSLAAEKMAVEMGDRGLEVAAISAQFMTYCDRGELERARELLQRVRVHTSTEREKQAYHLFWGVLEWMCGHQANGQEILERVASRYARDGNLAGLAAALGLQANLTLLHRGRQSADHLEVLERWMRLLAEHDLFDVVERYRPFIIPCLLNAVMQDVSGSLARNLLTRLGEPCQAALQRRLAGIAPQLWVKELMPEPVIPCAEATPSAPSVAAELSILTLGGLRLEYRGRTLTQDDFPTRKAMRLLAQLAVTRGPVCGERLLEQLWPDADPNRARNSLRTALHQLRRLLRQLLDDPASPVFERNRKTGTVCLQLEYGLDFEQFIELLQQVDLEHCKQALALYRGEFLEGLEDDWIEGLRIKLRDDYVKALQLLGRCYLDQGQTEAAELAVRKALSIDDLREESHRLLVETLVRDGRSADAVRHYEAAVDLFEQEIGVAPLALAQPLKEAGLML